MNARFLFALFVVSSLSACGGDSVTTPEQPGLERGLHEVGIMTQPRIQHFATLMQNGTVLIGGGYKEPLSTRRISAEIFDPLTGTSSPTGNMSVNRSTDKGILLADGRILIMPRYHDFPVEIYDPHSARFVSLAKIPWLPPITTANLLQSGRIFVTTQQHSALFDPAAGAFTSVVAMEETRKNHTSTLLKDGHVLIVGGSTGNNELTGRNLIYHPSSNGFTEAGRLQVDRWGHTAVLLHDGRVLILGGHTGSEQAILAEMYDTETDTFLPVGVAAISPLAALLLPSGRVLLIHVPNGNIVLYNPDTHVLSPTAYSIGPWRSGATVTLLEDNRVMIAGGWKYSDSVAQGGDDQKQEITDQVLIFTP